MYNQVLPEHFNVQNFASQRILPLLLILLLLIFHPLPPAVT